MRRAGPAPRRLMEALAAVAPGQPLREGLDRILQAEHGRARSSSATGPRCSTSARAASCSTPRSARSACRELAKMDGAIILAADASRIARANVHLVPNPNVPTSETGTRHRTAERVARSIDVPVISVSEDMADHRRLRRRREAPARADPRACSTGPTRPCRRSSATRTASTTCRRRCPRSRSRTSSRARRRHACCSAPRWCGASPRRSRATSSSSASTAGSSACSSRSCMGGVEDDRRLVIQRLLPRGRRLAPRRGARRAGRPRHRGAARPQDRRRRCCTCPAATSTSTRSLQPARLPAAVARSPACPTPVIEQHRRALRQPAEDHAGHHRRPRRRRGRGRDPGPGHQGRPVAASPRRSILDRYS